MKDGKEQTMMLEVLNETTYSTEDLKNFCAELDPRFANTTVQVGYYIPKWIKNGAKTFDATIPAHQQPRARVTKHGRGVVRVGLVRPQFIGISALEQIAAAGEEGVLALPEDVHVELAKKIRMSGMFSFSAPTPDTTIHVVLETKGAAARSKKLMRLRKQEAAIRTKKTTLVHWKRSVANLEDEIVKLEAKAAELRNKL
jgi:hypothetical protein